MSATPVMLGEGRDALFQLATKVSDLSSAVQGQQVEIAHTARGVEKLLGVSEKQIDLAHQLERNNDEIKRAFGEMREHKSDLTTAIDKLADAFKNDRGDTKKVTETVAGFQGSLRTLKVVGGTVVTLLVVIASMFVTAINKDIAGAASASREKNGEQDAERTALAIKVDALSMQVQEVRLDRQRDREAEATP